MNHYIVLDLETQKAFSEVRKGKTHELKVSVVGIYDSADNEYVCYEESEIPKLEQRLKNVDYLIGFNIRHFDMPVLQPYLLSSITAFPLLDLMEEVEKVRGHRVSLHSIAQATFGRGKIGHSEDAIQLFRQGRMEELKRYCLEDVRLTKEIYDFGKQEGKILFQSHKDWKVHEVPVEWGKQTFQVQQPNNAFPTSLF